MNYLLVFVLPLLLISCGSESEFSSLGGSYESGTFVEENPESAVEEESDSQVNDDQVNDAIKTAPGGAGLVSEKVWIETWNTDPYTDSCIILVEGVSVVKESCEEINQVVCETSCQADATNPAQCGTEFFEFLVTDQFMDYHSANDYCASQNMVMMKYSIYKVPSFRSQLRTEEQ